MPDARLVIAALPAAEVEKICAGEVVERPLSVVKELLENALDAGAGRIAIELEDGGKELIRVSDDGCGIPSAELPLALKRHHTSKIRCLDDLFAATTLGFRGEALGSIAAVSRLVLTSRHQSEELGARLECSGGELAAQSRLSFQRGTEVEVRELFYNTPVRKKFLKSKQSEVSQIAALTGSYALAYPQVRFSLVSSGRSILASDGEGGTRAVLAGLASAELAREMLEIDFEFPPLALRGLLSPPQLHRHNRARQWYFINGRPVVNKMLYRAVDDALREYLSDGKYPAGVFFIELPPEEVDVNVHPMKSEVNFAQPQAVYSLIVTALRRTLGRSAQRTSGELRHNLSRAVQPLRPEAPGSGLGEPLLEAEAPPGQRAVPLFKMNEPLAAARAEAWTASDPAQSVALNPPLPPLRIPLAPQERDAVAGPPIGQAAAEAVLPPPGSYQGVLQVAGSYLVACTAQEVLLIDQHAAHERILFEQLTAQAAAAGPPPRQRLLFPLVIALSPAEAELAAELLPQLDALGFSCALGAGPSLVLSEVPLPLKRYVTAALLHAVLSELAEQSLSPALDKRATALAASLACKAAIKAGDRLPPSERAALVEELLSGLSALSCPHGRPCVIRLDAEALGKLFLRS